MKIAQQPSQTSAIYPSRSLALVLGIFLLIEGIWGLFSPVVFGVLTTNHLHACIHVVLGVAAIWSARTGHARSFLIFVGVLLAVVGALWFLPATRGLVMTLFAVNKAVALVNLIIGAVCLLVAFGANRSIKA